VLESSVHGAGVGKEGPASSTAQLSRVGWRWRGVSLAVLGSATTVTAVELRSEGNKRVGRRGGVRVAGCSGTFYRAEGRSGGDRPLKGRWRHSGAPLCAISGRDQLGGGK
jgi:hypothetical protein